MYLPHNTLMTHKNSNYTKTEYKEEKTWKTYRAFIIGGILSTDPHTCTLNSRISEKRQQKKKNTSK